MHVVEIAFSIKKMLYDCLFNKKIFPAACDRVVVGLAWSSDVVSCLEDNT